MTALVALVGALGCEAPKVDLAPRPAIFNIDELGIGLHGYDPVSYFPEGGGVPRVGAADINTRYEGVVYRFVGEANRRRFLGNPERYAPLYGGWSAWGMVEGQRMDVDPTSFLIQDGRLLVFFSGTFSDGRAKWLQRDGRELRERADRAWSTLRSKEDSPGPAPR